MKERIKEGISKILKENINVSEHEDYTDYEQLILSIGSFMERNSIDPKTKIMDKELKHIREVLLAYHKYLEGFNDPTIYNVPIEWIDNFLETKTKMMDKSKCCNENTIKYSSTGVEGDVNTHYTCTNCGKISDKTKMRIEWLINNTYQVTDGSTVWFQGTKLECEEYLNQNKDE
jgi:hypothetical protein